MSRGYEPMPLVGGHRGKITAIAFSPQATYLATAALDSNICIWDVASATLFCVYRGDSVPLSLIWLPHREDRLLCGLANGYVVSLSFSANIARARGLVVHTFPVECLAVKGSQVASSAHRELRIWNWQGDGPWYHCMDLPELSGGLPDDPHEVLITGLHWTDTELITTYLNHGIRIYETRSWTCVVKITSENYIVCTALSKSGTLLLGSNLMTGFDLYDLDQEALVRAFGHDVGEKRATPVKFIESDRAVIGGTTVGSMYIWDIETGRIVQRLDHSRNELILAVDGCYDHARGRFLIATGSARDSPNPVMMWMKKQSHDRPAANREKKLQPEQASHLTLCHHILVLAVSTVTVAGGLFLLYQIYSGQAVPSAIPSPHDPSPHNPSPHNPSPHDSQEDIHHRLKRSLFYDDADSDWKDEHDDELWETILRRGVWDLDQSHTADVNRVSLPHQEAFPTNPPRGEIFHHPVTHIGVGRYPQNPMKDATDEELDTSRTDQQEGMNDNEANWCGEGPGQAERFSPAQLQKAIQQWFY